MCSRFGLCHHCRRPKIYIHMEKKEQQPNAHVYLNMKAAEPPKAFTQQKKQPTTHKTIDFK